MLVSEQRDCWEGSCELGIEGKADPGQVEKTQRRQWGRPADVGGTEATVRRQERRGASRQVRLAWHFLRGAWMAGGGPTGEDASRDPAHPLDWEV